MRLRRSDHDVTNRIRTTDPRAVGAEVARIFHGLFPRASTAVIERAVRDAARLYEGRYPGYLACDTGYHNLQHALEVTLAMARIMAGHQVRGQGVALSPDLFSFGVLAALFHDAGYIRRTHDTRHRNGAEYTRVHVSRGGEFLREYLAAIGMERFVPAAAPTLHFTGYEKPVAGIRVPDPVFRLLGNMLGTADILAQMSDRCYLEKCHDRLYPEFVLGGIDRVIDQRGNEQVNFASAGDLVFRTPAFYRKAMTRLCDELDEMLRFAGSGPGRNEYVGETEKNVRYAARLADTGDLGELRRRPPPEASGESPPAEAATEPEPGRPGRLASRPS